MSQWEPVSSGRRRPKTRARHCSAAAAASRQSCFNSTHEKKKLSGRVPLQQQQNTPIKIEFWQRTNWLQKTMEKKWAVI